MLFRRVLSRSNPLALLWWVVTGLVALASPQTSSALWVGFPVPRFGVFYEPEKLTIADFNDDGVMDIATANTASNDVTVILANPVGGFRTTDYFAGVTYSAGDGPVDILHGDFDSDGILDLAIANQSGGTFGILFGNGAGGVADGTFGNYTTIGSVKNFQGITIGDFNDDGIPDLAGAGYDTSTFRSQHWVAVFIGQGSGGEGDGTFAEPVLYNVRQYPSDIIVGDYNEDGISDLAIAHSSDVSTGVMIGNGTNGNGDGTFADEVSYSNPGNGATITQGDFNADGIVDLATANINDKGVRVFQGNGTDGVGDGTFTESYFYSVGSFQRPDQIQTGDLNRDGILDIVTTSYIDRAIHIALGNGTNGKGDGTFAPVNVLDSDFKPQGFQLVDVDGDNLSDMVIANGSDDDVAVLYGTGLGSFEFPQQKQIASFPGEIEVADFDKDGILDILVNTLDTSKLQLVRGNGTDGIPDGTLADPIDVGVSSRFTDFVVADFNEDGWIDYATTDFPDGEITIHLANEGGTSFSSFSAFLPDAEPGQIRAADYNGDDILDLSVTLRSPAGYVILLGEGDNGVGDGTFTALPIVSTFFGTNDHTFGYFNADNKLDLALSIDTYDRTGIFIGAGDGTFGSPVYYASGDRPQNVETADFNSDGILDLVVSNFIDQTLSLLIGNGSDGQGNGTFRSPVALPTIVGPGVVAINDFDGDGILDLATKTSATSTVIDMTGIHLGQGSNGVANGTFAPVRAYTLGSRQSGLATADLNEDGNIDLIGGSRVQVEIAYNVGSVVLPPPFVQSISVVGTPAGNASSVAFEVTFDQVVYNLSTDDFELETLSGTATGAVSGLSASSGRTVDVTASSLQGVGSVRMNLRANTDIEGVADTEPPPAFTAGEVLNVDLVPPTVESIAVAGDPAPNATSVQFLVTFSEPVFNVTIDDFLFSQVSGSTTGIVSAVSSATGNQITVTASSLSGDGSFRISLLSGTDIVDGAGNSGIHPYVNGEVVTIDQSSAEVESIMVRSPGNPTNAGTAVFDVEFSESVSNISADDFEIVTISGEVTANVAGVIPATGDYAEVTVENITGNGVIRLDLKSGTDLVDGAGNMSTPSFMSGEELLIDQTAPTVESIVLESPFSPTNEDTATFVVTFDEDVMNVVSAAFDLTTTNSVSGTVGTPITRSASVYTIPVTGISGDGTLRLDYITSTTLADLANNRPTTGFTGGSILVVDNTAPTVESIAVAGDPAPNATSVQFLVTFSEPVVNVTIDDFLFSQVSGSTTGIVSAVSSESGEQITVTASSLSGDGSFSISLLSGTDIVDGAGNSGIHPYVNGEVVTIDQSSAEVESIMVRSPGNPTNAGTAVFDVEFSESVSNISADDFEIVTISGEVTANVAGVIPATGDYAEVTVENITGNGVIRLDLKSGTDLVDGAGNMSTPSFMSGEELLIDQTAPTVESITLWSPSSPTMNAMASFDVTFSEPVENISTASFTTTATGLTTGTIESTSVLTDTSIRISVANIGGDGTLRVDLLDNSPIVDLAGNLIVRPYTSGAILVVDNTPPSVESIVLESPSSPTNQDTATFVVTFDEDVMNVGSAAFDLATTNSVSGTVGTPITRSASVYTIPVTGISGDGALRLDYVTSTTLADLANNRPTTGFTGGSVLIVDNTAPEVVSIVVKGDPAPNATSVQFLVTFSEPVTGLTSSAFEINGVTAIVGAVIPLASPDAYEVTVTGISGDGGLRLDLKAGSSVADELENTGTAAFTTGEVHTVDTVPPATQVTAPSGSVTQEDPELTVEFTSNPDAVSVELFYRFDFENFASAGAVPAEAGKIDFNASAGDGIYQFYTLGTDAAGNVEEPPAEGFDVEVTLEIKKPTEHWIIF